MFLVRDFTLHAMFNNDCKIGLLFKKGNDYNKRSKKQCGGKQKITLRQYEIKKALHLRQSQTLPVSCINGIINKQLMLNFT